MEGRIFNADLRASSSANGGSPSLSRFSDLFLQEMTCDLAEVQAKLDASTRHVHGFMQRVFDLKHFDVEFVHSRILQTIDRGRDLLSGDAALKTNAPQQRKIPKTIHRIWLTDVEAPTEPPAYYIDKMTEEARAYSADGWTHRLWVQDERLIPKTQKAILAAGGYVKLSRLESGLSLADPWVDVFNAFLRDRKFPFASDILRMKILQEYGGIYADMGARFKKLEAADFIVERFDYAFIFWETMFFQNSLMAMPVQSEIARIFMRLANDPYSIPAMLFPDLDGIAEGMAFSGLMVTAILLACNCDDLRICPLAPNGKLVEWASERSWYTDVGKHTGKFGNAFVPATGASFLKRDAFDSKAPNDIFSAPTPV